MKNNVSVEFRLSKDNTPGILMSFEELSQGGDVDILSHLLDDLKTRPLVGQVYSSEELMCKRHELPQEYRQDDNQEDFDITLVPKSYKRKMINFIVFVSDNNPPNIIAKAE